MARSGRLAAYAVASGAAAWGLSRRRAGALVRPRVSRLGRWLDPYPHIPADRMVVPPLPRGEVVDVPGRGEMFVRRAGEGAGAPILLLHGWMASADLNWFRLFEELSADRLVLAPDHRGHGRGIRSAARFTLEGCADDAAALLDALSIDRAVVLGYSMGGPIATLLWRRHPEKVAGLVLAATAMVWQEGWRERALWASMGPVATLLRWPSGRILLLRAMGEERDAIPGELTAYRAWAEGEFRRGDATDLADAGRALARYDARRFAPSIDVPAAVIVTTNDRLVPPERQFAMADAMGAKVITFHGDHSSAVVRSSEFAAVALDAIEHVLGAGAMA